jgi:hypothetical protein
MSALDFAKEEIKKQKAEQKKREEREEASRKYEEARRKTLQETVDKALSEFDGVKGIKRRGDKLFKKRNGKEILIAKLEVVYETWDNPNVDYKDEESGWVARYTVEGDPDKYFGCHNYDKGETGWYSDESFGKAMARHLK